MKKRTKVLGLVALAAATSFVGYETYSYEKVKRQPVNIPFTQNHDVRTETPWGNYAIPTAIAGGTGIFDPNNLQKSGGAVDAASIYAYQNPPFPKGASYRHPLPPLTRSRAVLHNDANTNAKLIGMV